MKIFGSDRAVVYQRLFALMSYGLYLWQLFYRRWNNVFYPRKIIDLMNKDLELEYSAAIQYINHAALRPQKGRGYIAVLQHKGNNGKISFCKAAILEVDIYWCNAGIEGRGKQDCSGQSARISGDDSYLWHITVLSQRKSVQEAPYIYTRHP